MTQHKVSSKKGHQLMFLTCNCESDCKAETREVGLLELAQNSTQFHAFKKYQQKSQ